VQPQFFAGFLSAFVLSYVGIGTSFCLQQRIERERPKLIFGLHSLSLAVCAATVAVFRAVGASDSYGLWTIAIGAELLAVALMLHFVLLFTNSPAAARLPKAIYTITLLFEVANLWRALVRPAVHGADVASLSSPPIPRAMLVHVSPLGGLAWLAATTAFLASFVLLARAAQRGRREAVGPMVGTIVASLSWGRDTLIAMGLLDGTFLGPLGGTILVVSVADAYLFLHARLSRELRRDYVRLRDAQRELRRKEQLTVIGELAAIVAHEIRNPLAIISNSVAGLRRRSLPDEEKDTLMRILDEESERLNLLVSNLLTYARPITPRPQRTSIGEILRRTMLSTASKGPLNFVIRQAAEADTLSADPDLLRHVLDNLVDNAGHAMNWRGTVEVVVHATQKGEVRGVTISVRDKGEGMNAEVSARARSPFFTTRPSGTGLGLAIVDRIVEAHGGELTIESEVGVGTTATVFIPDARVTTTPDPKRPSTETRHALAGDP
jgi:signal transduction histidine kinase